MSESIAKRRQRERGEESEVPPMVTCALCRRADCPGCAVGKAALPVTTVLAWEESGGPWLKRLWSTALASSSEPERTFGELPAGRVWSALAFALLAEALALGSLGLSLALAALAIDAEFSLRVFSTPVFAEAALAVLCASALLMVLLHLLWGLCIELGASSTGDVARFGQGMRFGLYACGWDLVTSPAGVIGGFASRGFFGAWRAIAQAAQVPRIALRAYADHHRKLAPRAQRRGTVLSIAVLGCLLLSTLGAAVYALVRFFVLPEL